MKKFRFAKKSRFGIAVSRFNGEITERLLKNCLSALAKAGVPRSRADVVEVPGGYELPWAAQELARSGRYDGVICLGAILRGATSQNEHIARSVIHHLHDISLATRVPVILGVITPDTWAQALARTRGALDRGKEAAHAAVAMAALRRPRRR